MSNQWRSHNPRQGEPSPSQSGHYTRNAYRCDRSRDYINRYDDRNNGVWSRGRDCGSDHDSSTSFHQRFSQNEPRIFQRQTHQHINRMPSTTSTSQDHAWKRAETASHLNASSSVSISSRKYAHNSQGTESRIIPQEFVKLTSKDIPWKKSCLSASSNVWEGSYKAKCSISTIPSSQLHHRSSDGGISKSTSTSKGDILSTSTHDTSTGVQLNDQDTCAAKQPNAWIKENSFNSGSFKTGINTENTISIAPKSNAGVESRSINGPAGAITTAAKPNAWDKSSLLKTLAFSTTKCYKEDVILSVGKHCKPKEELISENNSVNSTIKCLKLDMAVTATKEHDLKVQSNQGKNSLSSSTGGEKNYIATKNEKSNVWVDSNRVKEKRDENIVQAKKTTIDVNPRASISTTSAPLSSFGADKSFSVKFKGDPATGKIIRSAVSNSVGTSARSLSLTSANERVNNCLPSNDSPPVIKILKRASPLLPTTSSWGVSNSKSALSENSPTEETTKIETKIESKRKFEEFPSLSVAVTAPPQIQQTQLSQISTMTTPHAPINHETIKGSKKPSNTTYLESFLSSHIFNSSNNSTELKQTKNSITGEIFTNKNTDVKDGNAESVKQGIQPAMIRSLSCRRSDKNLHPSQPSISIFKGAVTVKKGRQLLKPKTKKLTTLKKRVLEERLRIWRERNGEPVNSKEKDEECCDVGVVALSSSTISRGIDVPSGDSALKMTTTLLIKNFVRPEEDDLTDNDEYDEIISNLISLAGGVGKVVSVFVPRQRLLFCNSVPEIQIEKEIAQLESKYLGSSFVRFASYNDVLAARDILNGVIIGGQRISTTLMDVDGCEYYESNIIASQFEENDLEWRLSVLRSMAVCHECPEDDRNIKKNNNTGTTSEISSSATIVLHNILCDDDYNDEDALRESVEDVTNLSRQYGSVVTSRAVTTGLEKGNVYITYSTLEVAEKAAQQLNGIVIGGSKILVQVDSSNYEQKSKTVYVILNKVITEDEFLDEECLNECIEDINNLASKYGVVGRISVQTSGVNRGSVLIPFLRGHQDAEYAVQELNGMILGGSRVSATVAHYPVDLAPSIQIECSNTLKTINVQELPPVYSGEKILSERFAACKRVPKIPNSGIPRLYASKIDDERAVTLLIEMLSELMRIQECSKDDKNARARRRLVMGLREVARGIRAHKVKMVVMANNLDEYGAIESKMQDILDMANAEEIPVVFELNKRKLGKALGKSIKVSVVGIQNTDGAQEQFKKLKKMINLP